MISSKRLTEIYSMGFSAIADGAELRELVEMATRYKVHRTALRVACNMLDQMTDGLEQSDGEPSEIDEYRDRIKAWRALK